MRLAQFVICIGVIGTLTNVCRGEFAEVNGVRMHYTVKGTGKPLLLLHGFFENGDQFWGPSVPKLSKHYRLIIPDLRCHGSSSTPVDGFTFQESAKDIIALLSHLKIDSCRAIGHSGGAMTLMHVALKRPGLLEGMILDGAAYHFTEDIKDTIVSLAKDLRNSPGFFSHVEVWHKGGRDQLLSLLDNFERLGTISPMDLSKGDLAKIRVPTLVLHGDRDEAFPVEGAVATYRAIPDASLAVVPGGRHAWAEEKPMPFLDVALEFLSGTDVSNKNEPNKTEQGNR